MSRFGPYHLLERICAGGMAEVFLARPVADPKAPPVVVKRILPQYQSKSDFLQMFLDEARLTRQLFHRNLVQVLDVGEVGGVHYIAMEYVQGPSLDALLGQLPNRTLPVDLASYVAAEVCQGLHYAHGRSDHRGSPLCIVHRDVSPENILISQRGEVKLTDFGIAKASQKLARTRTGQVKGKLAYMSPEQVTGKPVDHRSDIFSLSLVLYEATTGRRVFASPNDADVLHAIRTARYVSPEKLLPGYPLDLVQILARGLQRNPDARFADAQSMRSALKKVYEHAGDLGETLANLVRRLNRPTRIDQPRPVMSLSTGRLQPEEITDATFNLKARRASLPRSLHEELTARVESAFEPTSPSPSAHRLAAPAGVPAAAGEAEPTHADPFAGVPALDDACSPRPSHDESGSHTVEFGPSGLDQFEDDTEQPRGLRPVPSDEDTYAEADTTAETLQRCGH